MTYITNFLTQLTRMQWSDYLDIIVVAYLIYRFLPMIRSTGAMRVATTVGVLLLLTWVTELLNLHTLHFLLEQVMAVGLIAVVVLFQPELRRMLDHLGNVKFRSFFGMEKPVQEMEGIIDQTVRACEVMSRERVGALIVFARDNPLEEYVKTGTQIDAQVSEQLIRNIFFPKASLHDGAMIIRDGRVYSAGCVLPLSESHKLSADLGTRHRAGVGISEVSDAVVVIVSEETGTISVAVGGVLKRHLAHQTLERLLRNELCKEPEEQQENLVLKLRQKMHKKEKGGDENEK
ncbi:MAG: diadenylate cyclase CdaA [Oscillospiraceae bacterium]|nr:diadenylate cyclase CdaA [Oscillospiraceae bacterium]